MVKCKVVEGKTTVDGTYLENPIGCEPKDEIVVPKIKLPKPTTVPYANLTLVVPAFVFHVTGVTGKYPINLVVDTGAPSTVLFYDPDIQSSYEKSYHSSLRSMFPLLRLNTIYGPGELDKRIDDMRVSVSNPTGGEITLFNQIKIFKAKTERNHSNNIIVHGLVGLRDIPQLQSNLRFYYYD